MRRTETSPAEGGLPTWQQVQDQQIAVQHELGYVGVSLMTAQEVLEKHRPDLPEFARRRAEVRRRLLCQDASTVQTYQASTQPEPKWWRVARHLGLIVLSKPFYLIDAINGERRIGNLDDTYVLHKSGDIVPLASPYAYGLKDLRPIVRTR